ncbi:anti-sigma-K factor RskA [Litoreibacter meonggei]|uniref:Anti-sigma-K factor RskA n=1 Tax=Litoreibacter meonggei TaxID=1049199 RepID=A0A497WQK6_9RHOB|nr:anti-sigma factor [Litoreibacter meonggei]RLJ51644.1 anti-sigma-K factor RskA [Litoreibacter meonggei]
MTAPHDPNDDDILAAEYVLRLLDTAGHRQFEARLRDEPALRDLVHEWEARLAAIAASEVEEVAPPSTVKLAVFSAVAPETRETSSRRSWFTGLIGVAAAAAIAFVAIGPLLRDQVDLSPKFQTELASADGELVLVAGVIPAIHEIVIERVAGQAPEGRVLELWLIAEGSDAPISLGLLQTTGETRIRVADDIAPSVRSGTIAISEEPPGGSPTGMPTGQVLATGTFVDI